jgi:hypothetical protein
MKNGRGGTIVSRSRGHRHRIGHHRGRIDGWWGAMDFVPEFKFNSFHVGICMF